MTPPSDHLRALRARVPDVRLFAPRVALVLQDPEGGILVDREGCLPSADVEIETSVALTARRLLATLRLEADAPLRPLAVRTGLDWQEEHEELGALQPVWVVVRAATGASHVARLRPGPAPRLLTHDGRAPEQPPLPSGDYIRAVRARVGRDRIFYPWAGFALRDEHRRVFLVRLGDSGQWHCPGGGVEPGETIGETATRELAEETGLVARPGRLVGVWSRHLRAFANGDRIQGIATLLEGEVTGGSLRPDPTGEIDRAGWYAAGDLPDLRVPWAARVRLVLSGEGDRLD